VTAAQAQFKIDLQKFRQQVQDGPNFKGKAQVLRSLRRVGELAALK
jgi:hypothetical protein